MRYRPARWAFLLSFHVVLLLAIVGHVELVAEIGMLQIIRHEVFWGGGLLGLMLLAGTVFLLFRRFHAPLSDISEPSDYYVLLLLLLVVLFGSQLHLARRLFDYSTIGVAEYRAYLFGMLTLRPTLPEVFSEDFVGHSFLLVLHVFCANLLLMVLPWSKLVHGLLALPLARLRRT
jgi:nitrate reductase gamma subunit